MNRVSKASRSKRAAIVGAVVVSTLLGSGMAVADSVQNDAASSISAVGVDPATKRLSPTDTKVESIGESSATLTWQAPRDVSTIVGYRVKLDGKPVLEVPKGKADQTGRVTAVVPFLKPGEKYDFQVFSYTEYSNEFDDEKVSATARAVTGSTHLKAEAGISSVELHWDSGDVMAATGWRIYQYDRGSGEFKKVKEMPVLPGGKEVSTVIDGLESLRDYKFQVAAFSEHSESTRREVSVKTRVIKAPTEFTGVATTTKQVLLHWKLAEDPSGVTKYCVFKDDGTVAELDAPFGGKEMFYYVDNLDPDTTYRFRVEAAAYVSNQVQTPTIEVKTPRI
ncbi:fibronectin type III domain-containing protein [Kitasatospora sp. NPDC008050]|uniref:fibronectin type III domain-containing protein n=1 Tax=Kitasatospora sp. NPDC008050 TaxID=3364021 RepID=UPI0036E0F98F